MHSERANSRRHFLVEVEIHASRERVWELLCQLENWPAWTPSMLEVKPLEKGRCPGIGARYQVRQPKLQPSILTITEWEPLRGFVWESESTGLRASASHWIEKRRAGLCLLTLGVRYSGFFSPLVAALAGKITRDFLSKEAWGLKSAAEID